MSENVRASTSRNPKGLHGLYRDNFTFILPSKYKIFRFGFYGGRGELTFGTGGLRHQKGWETLR
jgi:hypothetical protein